MGETGGAQQQAALCQVLNDQCIGVLDKLAAPGAHLRPEGASIGDGHQQRQVVSPGSAHVLGIEGRGDVHQASAFLGGDVVLQDDEVSRLIGQ